MGNDCAQLYDALMGYGLAVLIVLAAIGVGLVWALRRSRRAVCPICRHEEDVLRQTT